MTAPMFTASIGGIKAIPAPNRITLFKIFSLLSIHPSSAAARQTAPGLQISLLLIYIAVPIGCLFALLFIIEQIVDSILRRREQIE